MIMSDGLDVNVTILRRVRYRLLVSCTSHSTPLQQVEHLITKALTRRIVQWPHRTYERRALVCGQVDDLATGVHQLSPGNLLFLHREFALRLDAVAHRGLQRGLQCRRPG